MNSLQQRVHDIRKPLNTISMQAELIKILSHANDTSLKVEEASNKIIFSAKHCSDLLQDLYEEIECLAAKPSASSKDR
ncbi:hypothetical protein GPUN_2424 [Glaciecola punicea ACAM 611]|jgi:signal transduction histidine kinase|uniref:histidine kinase n=1 Tax=Glaciecola punicea ACAM 611 TaxID=1121923 RepID=H5TE12_9ALTE|nr:histidine kinase dimerization/phospho-acceptor domain-containing protein [Glaciecola punicea]OFA31083.1 histidine kinase [Glaciecola punicea]GAB56539.1 hypothetical protein GPUN_2424 [Glaciecola punicea ACAM 611]